MAVDENGDSVLKLCFEYEYEWILPAFEKGGGEAKLFASADDDRKLQYAVTLLMAGYGTKVQEMIDDEVVVFTEEKAMEIMELCNAEDRFSSMKEPVETFELLQTLIIGEEYME